MQYVVVSAGQSWIVDEGVTLRSAGAPEPSADEEDGDPPPPLPPPAPPCLRMLALGQARSGADMAGVT